MATQKVLDKNIKDLVRRYLGNVQEAGIEIAEAFVFGSHAIGQASKHSDVDLAVVSPNFGKNHHQELVSLFRLIDAKTREIEPIPFSPQELKDKWNPLVAEVRRKGIVVYP